MDCIAVVRIAVEDIVADRIVAGHIAAAGDIGHIAAVGDTGHTVAAADMAADRDFAVDGSCSVVIVGFV